MAHDFRNEKIEHVADDFTYNKGAYDEVMDAALGDMASALKEVKDRRDGFVVSDDVTALMEEHGEKFASALNEGSAAERKKWLPQLTEILVAAADANPRNASRLVESAAKIESGFKGADSGILLALAERVTFRYPEHSDMVVKAVDTHLQNYEKQPIKDAETYKAFYKVYTNAFRKTRSAEIRNKTSAMANDIFGRIEILKGNVSFDKLLQRVKENPTDEATTEAFERDLNVLMAHNPQQVAADIKSNLKGISKLDSADARSEIFTVLLDAMAKNIKAETPETRAEKSGLMFSVFNDILRAEKDEDVKREIALSATDIAMRHLVDENGAVVLISGQEKPTLDALNRMADANGGRFGLKDVLAKTADKYRKFPEIAQAVKMAMLKTLDADEKFGNPVNEERSPLEIEMMAQKRNRDNKNRLDKQIYTLLNIPNKKLGVERDAGKTYYPTKSEMRRVVNLLSQYRKIDDYLPTCILGKMDTEKFTNIDDAILDTFTRATSRMQAGKEVADRLTAMRAQMHAKGIQDKKAQLVTMDRGNEKLSETPKKTRAVFRTKDVPSAIEK